MKCDKELQAALGGRGPCDVIATSDGLIVKERASGDRGSFVSWDGRRAIGTTDGGLLVGFDSDGSPVVWRQGERAVDADALGDWGGWHVHRAGLVVAWVDPRGRLHSSDGSIHD